MIVGGMTAMNVPMLGMKLAANTRNAHRAGNGTPSTSSRRNESDRGEHAELRPDQQVAAEVDAELLHAQDQGVALAERLGGPVRAATTRRTSAYTIVNTSTKTVRPAPDRADATGRTNARICSGVMSAGARPRSA